MEADPNTPLAWAIDRNDAPDIRKALHATGIDRERLIRRLRWLDLVLTRTEALKVAEHLPPGWLRGRLMHRIYGLDDDAGDRALILRAVSYRSGKDSCNSVYLGSLALHRLYQVFDLGYTHDSARDLAAAVERGTRTQLDQAMNIASNVILFMEENPRERCPCCGQIMPAKAFA